MGSANDSYRVAVDNSIYSKLIEAARESGYRERIGNTGDFGEVSLRENVAFVVVVEEKKLLTQITRNSLNHSRSTGAPVYGAALPYKPFIIKRKEKQKRRPYKTKEIIVTDERGKTKHFKSVKAFCVYLEKFIRKGRDVNPNKIYQVIGVKNKNGEGYRSMYGYTVRYVEEIHENGVSCPQCEWLLFCLCDYLTPRQKRKYRRRRLVLDSDNEQGLLFEFLNEEINKIK